MVHENGGSQNRYLPMAGSLPQGPQESHEVSTVLAESTGDNSPASPLWMPLSVRFSEKNFWNFEMHNLEGKHKQKIQRLIINQFLANRNSYERHGRQILYVLTCYVSQELDKEGQHPQPYISAPDRTQGAM